MSLLPWTGRWEMRGGGGQGGGGCFIPQAAGREEDLGLNFSLKLADPTLWLQVLGEVAELMLLCKMRTMEDPTKFSMGSLAHHDVPRILASFSHVSHCLLHLYPILSNLPHTGEHKVTFPSLGHSSLLFKPFSPRCRRVHRGLALGTAGMWCDE